ncbi:MAG: extracellular solute-binding protein, partial [Chthoniobacterales bacterium]|nr:extracellular solute-binding protein [Chthoniobacterales bacterium]
MTTVCKTVFATLLVVALTSPLLGDATPAAPAAAPDASQTIHLRAERLPDQARHDIGAVASRAVLRAFVEAHPGVDLEPFVMPQVSTSTSFDSGPLMAIAGGVPPNVMFVNFRRSSTYIAQGFLEPMEVLIARVQSANPRVRETGAAGKWLADPSQAEIEKSIDAIKSRIPPPMWPVIYREDETGVIAGRHVWCINTTNLIVALLYRKDLFYDAGLDPERPPRDWNEFLEYARRLTIPERNQYGLGLYGPTMSWATSTFFTSNGARIVEKDSQGKWSAVYGSDDAADALHFIWRLCREPFKRDGRTIRGTTLIYPDRLDIPWNRGQLGMQLNYLNEELLSNINPQLIGIAPVPLSPKGTRSSEINGEMLGVFSGSTPAQKLAAAKYIWFVTSDEALRIRTKTYVDGGYGIVTSPELLRRFGYDRLLAQVPKEWSD